jgi:hypothetical protein
MRFLNADPSGFSGGSNWFAYADGNPISLSDPFGLLADKDDFWGQVGDAFNSLGDSMFHAARDPEGAMAAGTDRMVDGVFGGGRSILGHIEPLKEAGVYQAGSSADKGGDFMAAYFTAVGFAAGTSEGFGGNRSALSSRVGASLGEQFLVSDEAMVHFSPQQLSLVKGVNSSDVFAFTFGDIKNSTSGQIEGLIGSGAAGGERGGASFMHVLETGGKIPEPRTISGTSVNERVFDSGSFGVRSRFSVK